MQFQNSLNFSNGLFFRLKSSFKKLYKNSKFYDRKISKTFECHKKSSNDGAW